MSYFLEIHFPRNFPGKVGGRLEWTNVNHTKKKFDPQSSQNVIFRGVTIGKMWKLALGNFSWGNPVVPRLGWLLGIRIPYKPVRELHVGYYPTKTEVELSPSPCHVNAIMAMFVHVSRSERGGCRKVNNYNENQLPFETFQERTI